MHPLARIVLGLTAGLFTLFLLDRLLWTGALLPGAVGVLVAVILLVPFGQRSDGN